MIPAFDRDQWRSLTKQQGSIAIGRRLNEEALTDVLKESLVDNCLILLQYSSNFPPNSGSLSYFSNTAEY